MKWPSDGPPHPFVTTGPYPVRGLRVELLPEHLGADTARLDLVEALGGP